MHPLLRNTLKPLATAAADSLAIALRALPRRIQVLVRDRTAITGRLDLDGPAVRLSLESEAEFVSRLRSCRKEPETIQWLRERVRPGQVLYDIGANVGAYSLAAHALLGGDLRVVAFEPGFATYAQLCRNIVLNGAQEHITAVPLLLGDRVGRVEFRYSSTRPGAARHASALGGVERTPECVQWQLVDRLDDLVARHSLPRPHHVKIDVDGAELAVVRGMGKLLRDPSLETVLVELDAEGGPVDQLLRKAGLALASRHPHGPGAGVTNCIYARQVEQHGRVARDD